MISSGRVGCILAAYRDGVNEGKLSGAEQSTVYNKTYEAAEAAFEEEASGRPAYTGVGILCTNGPSW